jgi:hypothetical protein
VTSSIRDIIVSTQHFGFQIFGSEVLNLYVPLSNMV